MRRWILITVVLMLFSSSACREPDLDPDATGIDVTVTYDRDLTLDQLAFQATIDGGLVFNPGLLPDTSEDLDPAGETAVILVPEALSGRAIRLRVDGLFQNEVQASESVRVRIRLHQLAIVEIDLNPGTVCGDGRIKPDLEACDDKNRASGDSCGIHCTIEPGWSCSGEPSRCYFCGNAACDPGEDLCTCPADCAAAVCGDGRCCAAGGEDAATCPDDCA